MKKILTILILTISIVAMFSACGSSSSGSSSYSSSGSKSTYDRQADYVAGQFGTDSDHVKDSVGALAGAMR